MYGYSAETLEESGTAYTLTASDAALVIWTTNSSPVTITLPEDATEDLPVGFQCVIIQYGSGKVTFEVEGSDDLFASGGLVSTAQRYSSCSVIKKESGVWWLGGERV